MISCGEDDNDNMCDPLDNPCTCPPRIRSTLNMADASCPKHGVMAYLTQVWDDEDRLKNTENNPTVFLM